MFWKRKHLGIIWPKCKFKLTCGNDSDNSLIDLDFIFYFFIAQTLLSDSKIPSLAYQKQQKREDLTTILVNALMDLVAVVLQLMQFHIDFQLSIQLYFSSNWSGLKWVFFTTAWHLSHLSNLYNATNDKTWHFPFHWRNSFIVFLFSVWISTGAAHQCNTFCCQLGCRDVRMSLSAPEKS